MILFFGNTSKKIFAVQVGTKPSIEDIRKLSWLFGNQPRIEASEIRAFFVGPRAAMITPWSTNAVEITQNMAISGIQRIEEFTPSSKEDTNFDPMLFQKYGRLNQDIFTMKMIIPA